MSAFHKIIAPWRVALAAAGGFAVSGAAVLTSLPAQAAAPRFSDTMPLSQVKPGMKGYGLTTFKGTTISRFEVTIIGILKKENAGHDLILIRMKGGPITERGANLIHGMSGSPIYIGNKIIGAFSQGEEFPKEPVGMVTPIDDMLEAWDPNIPQQPSYFQPADKNESARKSQKIGATWKPDNSERVAVLPQPLDINGRKITRLVLNARADDPRRSQNGTAILRRATSLLSVTGLKERDRVWLQKELDQRGFAMTVAQSPIVGGGRNPGFKGAPLKPGSAFGTFLSTGDIQVGSTGTVTYRRGDRILGYGHPFFGLGAMEAAITSASIVDIFSGVNTSHHIAVAGPVIGTLLQDRNFSVSAQLGKMPHTIPFDVVIHDETSRRSQTFHSDLFLHPDLTPILLRLVAKNSVANFHSVPGDTMARITTTVEAEEAGRITRTNLFFDDQDISGPATQDLSEITSIISGNPFYPLPVKNAKMTIDIFSGHNTATIERIFLKQGRYEPGDTMDIGVVLKPYRRDPVLRSIALKIPSETPTGRYQLVVRGGVANIVRFGGLVLGGGSQDGAQAPPVNVSQMVARLNQRETNTDMVARLVLNTVAPALEGEKLSQLPPNLSALMRSDRNSGVRLERDEVKTIQRADYVTSGTQQLIVTVVRKNTQEPASGSGTGLPTSSGGTGVPALSLPGTSGSGSLSNPADDAEPSGVSLESLLNSGDNLALLNADPLTRRWLAALHNRLPEEPQNGKKAEEKKSDEKAKTEPAKDDKKDAAKPAAPPTAVTTTPPPPAAPDTSNDKPVGRQMQVWRQTARTDFSAGKFTGTGVAATGVLRISPTLRRLASSTETYIWSLAADDQGNLYAGTGTGGKILKVDAEGKSSVFAALPVVSVQSVYYSKKEGVLYAGSGIKGQVYKLGKDGTYRLLCTIPEKYILAIAEDESGDLYIGPGGGGTVYKLNANAFNQSATGGADADKPVIEKPTAFIKTTADHIMALVLDGQKNLYVGTGNDGIVYKVSPDGKSSVLYDAKENAITALAADGKGNIYATTGPKGILYRISPEGGATVLFDRAAQFYTGLKTAPDGTLYATTVNAVFHIFPSDTDPSQMVVVPLDNPKDVDFLSLAVLPDGSVAAGTGNVGEIYGVGPRWNGGANAANAGAGMFESVVHDSKLISQWGTARWEALLPAGSSVRVETRVGNVAEPDTTWSDWASLRMTGRAEGKISSPPARFIQYRISLQAGSGEQPSLREISLGYLPRNQAPKIAFQSPVGGERWAKNQTIRWTGTDPDNDTLTYELFYSTDAGANWKPFPTQPKPAAGGAAPVVTPTTPIVTPSVMPPLSLEAFQKQLDAQNFPETVKQALLEGYKRRMAGGGAAGSTTPAGSLRDTSKVWDTTTLPDGLYWLKVVASDHVSNPTDALAALAISEPFLVCNALPQIRLLSTPVFGPDKSVALEGTVSQAMVAVTAVQYRIDGGEWIAASSKDGLFDSSQESFSLTSAPLAAGKHAVEVEAFNAAGGKITQKMEVVVP